MTNVALRGKPKAGNQHVWVDMGESASAATPRRGSLLYSKVKAATVALMAVFAAAPLAAANDDDDYQFIISGDPIAAETVGSSSDSSVASALVSGTLADVLESAFETRYCTWCESPAQSLRSDECRGMMIFVR